LGLAVSQGRSGDKAGARKSLATVLRLRPRSRKIRKAVGLVYYLMGDFAGAERTFAALVRQAPDRPDFRLLWGRVLLKLGRAQDAFRVLSKARQQARGARGATQRSLKHLAYYLAEAQRLQGRCRAAKRLYRAYLAKVPSGPLAQAARAHLRACPK
jgi:predicted Zn-dependent protease